MTLGSSPANFRNSGCEHALECRLKPIMVISKIDRRDARGGIVAAAIMHQRRTSFPAPNVLADTQ